jgi:hypothetical protein
VFKRWDRVCSDHTFPGEQVERYRQELLRLLGIAEERQREWWLMGPDMPDNGGDWMRAYWNGYAKTMALHDALVELEVGNGAE